MSNLQQIKSIIEQFPLDLCMEVILADLIEGGINVDDLILHPVGLFERSYRKDIREVELHYDQKTGKIDYAYLHICREGLYDALPEALFHAPLSQKSFKSKDEMIAENQVHQREEEESRKFFVPFEHAFYQQRLALELEERKALVDFSGRMFKKFWGITDDFDERQVAILLYVLPVAHRIVGNWHLTALCLEAILGINVKVQKTESETIKVNDYLLNRLGNLTLGVDAVLGNEFDDGIGGIEILLGPLDNAQIKDYLKGGQYFEMLHYLYDYFLPIEVDVKTTILVKEQDKIFELEKEKRLGFTTLI